MEWYRVDPSMSVVRVLLIAAPVLLVGCLSVAFAWLATHRPVPLRAIVGAIGAAANVGGPLYAIFGLRRILMEDAYIAMRTDGVAIRDDAGERVIAWDAIESASVKDNQLALMLRNHETTIVAQRFSGISPEQLARRVEHLRRREAMGLRRG